MRRIIVMMVMMQMMCIQGWAEKMLAVPLSETQVSIENNIPSSTGITRNDLMGLEKSYDNHHSSSPMLLMKNSSSEFGGATESGNGSVSWNHQFQTNEFSGSVIFQYSIDLPSGRVGMKPDLVLTYSPRNGNGMFGFGWALNFGSIERSLKYGVPRYENSDTFLSTLDGVSRELVSLGGGRYREKVESSFMEYLFDGQRWTARDKQGRIYEFGLDQLFHDDSRVYDPNNPNRIYRWRLSQVKDVHGNYFVISYRHDGSIVVYYTGEPGTDRLPLASQEKNFPVKVTIEAESTPRPDTLVHYRSGFPVFTPEIIHQVTVEAGGRLYRSYQFHYETSARSGMSLMKQITVQDAHGQSLYPSMVFSYTDQDELGYEVSSIFGDPTVGDTKWNYRVDGGMTVVIAIMDIVHRQQCVKE
jgi:hypothetical protein